MSIQADAEIVIEERDAQEVAEPAGRRIVPEGINVYNPAFDITPNRYINAIITESGIILPLYSENIDSVFRP